MMFRDYITFIKGASASFCATGAMVPSSPFLAREMVRPIRESSRPLRILEVGAGTGALTRQIIKLMRSEDHLVICEMNKLFLTRLKNNIEKNQDFFLNRDRIQYHEGPVEDYAASNPESRFDLIICSLPFSNFSPEFVDRLMGIFALLLLEGGTFIFFEYVALRKLGQIFATAPVRSRMKAVDQVIDKWEKRAQQTGVVESRVALLNIPPAITFQFSYH